METRTATIVQMPARDRSADGSLVPASESAMFMRSLKVGEFAGCGNGRHCLSMLTTCHIWP